jgi:hypothetical protein
VATTESALGFDADPVRGGPNTRLAAKASPGRLIGSVPVEGQPTLAVEQLPPRLRLAEKAVHRIS